MSRPELIRALWYGDVQAIQRLYKTHAALFSDINDRQCTAAHILMFTERADILTVVLQLDETLVDKPNMYGDTPMHFAAKYDNQIMIDALHLLGSYAHETENRNRKTPYDVAQTPQLRQHILDLYFERSITRDLVATLDED